MHGLVLNVLFKPGTVVGASEFLPTILSRWNRRGFAHRGLSLPAHRDGLSEEICFQELAPEEADREFLDRREDLGGGRGIT